MAFKACNRERVLSAHNKKGQLTERITLEQWCWPDGESWMEQEVLVADMFVIVRDEVERSLNRG